MTTYRISQLAQRAGVAPTTLRFYEQEGLLPARRTPGGYRIYDDRDVERLAFIASGKHLGLPLDEIRDLLATWADGPCADVRELLRPLVLTRMRQARDRAAELDEFVARLRSVVTALDGPAPPGPCVPGCGVPQAVAQGEPVIACSLEAGDRAACVEQWADLLVDAVREPIPGGLRLTVDAGLAGPIAELAVAEQRCCPFLTFTLRATAAGLQLDVGAPAAAAPLVAEVFGVAEQV